MALALSGQHWRHYLLGVLRSILTTTTYVICCNIGSRPLIRNVGWWSYWGSNSKWCASLCWRIMSLMPFQNRWAQESWEPLLLAHYGWIFWPFTTRFSRMQSWVNCLPGSRVIQHQRRNMFNGMAYFFFKGCKCYLRLLLSFQYS